MRTTLTLEPDVAVALERLKAERGLSLKAAVNEALRFGIRALQTEAGGAAPQPCRIEPWDGGHIRLDSVDDTAEALAFAEGEAFR